MPGWIMLVIGLGLGFFLLPMILGAVGANTPAGGDA